MLGAENTVVITTDSPIPDTPRKANPKSRTYNRKCRYITSYWEVLFMGKRWTNYCNRPTKQGRLYCTKHGGKP